MRPLLVLPLAPFLLQACGDKCPEGYQVNDADKTCVEITSDTGTTGADGADGADGGDGSDGADGTDGTDGSDGGDGADGTGGTDTLPDGALDGEVEIYGVVEGDLTAWRAFSYEGPSEVSGGNLLFVYMSTSKDATCSKVVDYLLGENADPSDLFPEDSCNLRLQFFNPSFGTYSESNPLSVTTGSKVDTFVECSFGPGEWVGDGGPINGWTWTDRGDPVDSGETPKQTLWFQGVATEGTIIGLETISGGHEPAVNLDTFAGSFPYTDLGAAEARGSGKGTITTENCGGIANTRFYVPPPED